MEAPPSCVVAAAPPARSAGSRGKPHDFGTLTRQDFDGGPVSIDEVETGLFLGKL